MRFAVLVLAVLLAGCADPSTSISTTNASSGIQGHASVGPTCPVQRDPPDPNCADKPYKGALAVANAKDEQQGVFLTDENGNFTIALQPGTYTIRNVDGASTLPHCRTGLFDVSPANYTRVDVACDSGIR